MKTLFITLFVLIAGIINAQNTPDLKNVIEMNTRFTLKFTETEGRYSYQIVNKEAYNNLINLKNMHSLFSDMKSDEIQGVLAYTNYEKKLNAFLILKSGLKDPLKYNLRIKRADSLRFEESSALNLFFYIPSTEIWSFKIDGVILSDFENAITE